MKEVGAFEARKHLARLLDRVAQGESLTITRRGKPIARLVPVAGDHERALEAGARIFERRRHVKLIFNSLGSDFVIGGGRNRRIPRLLARPGGRIAKHVVPRIGRKMR